ncbi:MAG TPA: hypothetical protein VEB21_00440 [Terriglobales bacterium]|nr:hypothetical protein [Terriglobales bacterium]
MRSLKTIIIFVAATCQWGCTPAQSHPPELTALIAGPVYACCNLRVHDGIVSDGNWYESSVLYNSPSQMVPYGTRIDVVEVGPAQFLAYSENGTRLILSIDYGSEPIDIYMKKLLRPDDPRQTAASYPPAIQAAIGEARVVPDMTKEQVLMAIGYPPSHATPSLDAAEWHYWSNRYNSYKLHFSTDGRLERFSGRLPATFRR